MFDLDIKKFQATTYVHSKDGPISEQLKTISQWNWPLSGWPVIQKPHFT